MKCVLYSSLAKRHQNDWQTLQGRTNHEAGFLLLVITAKSAHDHFSMGSNLFSIRGRLKLGSQRQPGLMTVILKQNTENCEQTVCCETTLLGSTNVSLLTSYHNLPDAFKYLSTFSVELNNTVTFSFGTSKTNGDILLKSVINQMHSLHLAALVKLEVGCTS